MTASSTSGPTDEARFDELIVDTVPEYAEDFARAWWGSLPDEALSNGAVVALTSLPSAAARFYSLTGLLDRIEAEGSLNTLVYPSGTDHARGASVVRQDVYHQCSVLKARPARGRGRTSDVSVAPGAWMDLDTKAGSFAHGSDILALAEMGGPMEKAGIKPSISIRTNGMDGGRHFYWAVDRPVDVREMREVNDRLWLWVQAQAGVKVDNLGDPPRIFRLPGTVRWSKNGEGVRDGLGALVTPDWISGDVISLEKIREVTESLWQGWRANQSRVRRERAAADREVMREWGSSGVRQIERLTGLALAYALYEAREVFPLKTSWESILAPAGWTRYGEADDEGHQMWTRPHDPGEKVNPRSAVVDWDDSPNVMSLLSDSPATGLTRLVESGTPLSKVAVAAELHFGGSENAVLLDFIVRDKRLA